MLVRVVNADEAGLAAAASVDVAELHIDLTDPRAAAHALAVRDAFNGVLRLRFADAVTPELLEVVTDSRADELALPLAGATSAALLQALAGRDVGLVVQCAVAADVAGSLDGIASSARTVMFDGGPGKRLLDATHVARLDSLADTCRTNGWTYGFAGGLEAPDVARLLLLEPDVLGFDSAVRIGHDPAGRLDAAALAAMRALLPGEQRSARAASPTVRDKLFVRNFVVPLSIGAYLAERTAHQRVRFNVEVEVAREPTVPHDMRDVFSYDIIIETIRRLAARTHVTFVETLAEEIAAALLAQPAVLSTTVKVEKLDIIDGEVGIEICRFRQT